MTSSEIGDAAPHSAEREFGPPAHEVIATLDEGFYKEVQRFVGHPWREGPLAPQIKELVLMAIDAAATHRNGEGAALHARRAIAAGATREEVLEVLALTSTIGIHSCNCGVPVLLEELAAAGQPLDTSAPLTVRQEEVKVAFTEARGYWNEFWDGLLRLDVEFFAAYSSFSAYPWRHGTLEPKIRELIYTAFDTSATHMYEPGLRQHIRNALALGATGAEIAEVIELASGIGLEAYALAAAGLADECALPAGA
ncbi:MAG TPA: carboxymuconolactone decarboxylase family protein [Solirubrobacteraceae bacterium]|jgi:alkylhydroperoxidase/carboxymuconolactone decarboxylase family protein YurZ|nr:carboxymuconolactone decarboxylase family protein [Solirubrobacteraceae bacterium]